MSDSFKVNQMRGAGGERYLPPTSIAFFDVDHTIIKGYSGFFTTLILIQKGILKKRRLPLALFYRIVGPLFYEGRSVPLEKLYQIAINDMAGHSLEEILAIGRECFEKWVRPRIYAEAVKVIEEHKSKGEPVYLVTSGPSMAVRILAEFLGVDGRYSAGPVIDENGRLTPKLRLPVYYREKKLVAAEEAVRSHGADWRDCYFYSDSIDDLFLLEKVGHPRLVNPDKKLRRIGGQRGWPILTFSRLLANLPFLSALSKDSPRHEK